MVRCLANAILEFTNPESGEKVKTKIGFNQLPDWVDKLPYFHAASKSWHLEVFEGSSDKVTEEILKDEEKAAKLRDEIRALEEEKERVRNSLITGKEKLSDMKNEIAKQEEKAAAIAEEKASIQNNKNNRNNRR